MSVIPTAYIGIVKYSKIYKISEKFVRKCESRVYFHNEIYSLGSTFEMLVFNLVTRFTFTNTCTGYHKSTGVVISLKLAHTYFKPWPQSLLTYI